MFAVIFLCSELLCYSCTMMFTPLLLTHTLLLVVLSTPCTEGVIPTSGPFFQTLR